MNRLILVSHDILASSVLYICISQLESSLYHHPAYQVARAIADIHDIEDDGHPSIIHSKFISSLATVLFRELAC